MGSVVPRSAGVERIVGDMRKTLESGRARGGTIKEATEGRLGLLEAPLLANEQALASAQETEDRLLTELDAADEVSDLTIGAVCDEIWNELGRPASSPDYAVIVGSGIAEWRNGPAERQPTKMRILADNIRATPHPKLAARKEGWAARIEALAEVQQQAATPLQAAAALVISLRNQRRTLANHAQMALGRLKRDLKNEGLTEPQIHELIPDYPRAAPKKPTGE